MGNSRLRFAGKYFRACTLVGVILLTSGVARAVSHCPWLNDATASALLGGDATGAYIAEKGQPPVCTFTERSAKLMRTLQVSVTIVGHPHAQFLSMVGAACASKALSPVPAIGNEAMSCAIGMRSLKVGRRVVGRVRDQVFVVTLGTSIKSDSAFTPSMLEMKISTAAEQVSGNLF